MSLTKPNQELNRDLQAMAADLKWSTGDMIRIADHLSATGNEPDAWALLQICKVLQAGESKLNVYAEEVSSGKIQRDRPN